MLNKIESFDRPLASPTGHITLRQRIRIADTAARVMEIVSHGNAFIAPGSIEKTRHEQGELHARLALLLESCPELDDLYERHAAMLNEYHTARKQNDGNADNVAAGCVTLGKQIAALEQSIDLG